MVQRLEDMAKVVKIKDNMVDIRPDRKGLWFDVE